jgi:hypothetical protein
MLGEPEVLRRRFERLMEAYLRSLGNAAAVAELKEEATRLGGELTVDRQLDARKERLFARRSELRAMRDRLEKPFPEGGRPEILGSGEFPARRVSDARIGYGLAGAAIGLLLAGILGLVFRRNCGIRFRSSPA